MVVQLLLASLLIFADDPRPYLGVQMSVQAGPIEIDQRSFAHGIRLDQVVPDGPAATGGLRTGDVVVEIEGTDLNCPDDELVARMSQAILQCKVGAALTLTVLRDGVDRSATLDGQPLDDPQAWSDPDTYLGPRPPGSRLSLIAERSRRLERVTVTVGAAPAGSGAPRDIPANEKLLDRPPTPLREQQLADALIRQYGFEANYADLRARLARLVEKGDPARLNRLAYAMRDPFSMPVLARQLADAPGDLPALINHAALWLDSPPSPRELPVLRTGLSVEQHAEQIEQRLQAASALYEQAFAQLSDEERAFIPEAMGPLSDALIQHVMILNDPDADRLAGTRRLVELAARVDRAALAAAAMELAPLFDAQYVAGLKADLSNKGDDLLFRKDTPFGPIVFLGPGDGWFQEDAAVIVDLGGDDFYTHAMHRPLSVQIDLGGDDQYQSTGDFAQGGAVAAISLLYDGAGNDTYIAQRWAQGAAAFGVGVLWDRDGDDTFRAADYSQAAAFCGVGLLIDEDGDDHFESPRYAQALGLPSGFAALIERGGNDHYYCSGRDLTAYGTPGVFDAFGQGCAMGFRSLASGGVALLLDEAGDDTYEAGNFAQGGGYYFGWGCLVDRAGSDRYFGSRYAQGFAAHQAIGFLEDCAGNDRYVARRTVGQSSAWDESITALIDRAGDDDYSGGGFALCASAHNGLALFIDYAGRDRYRQHGGEARAFPNDYHGGTSFSLLIDYGGDPDAYPAADLNGRAAHGGQHGVFLDLPGDLDRAMHDHVPQDAGTNAGP